MADPKLLFDQLDGRFSKFYGKSSTDYSLNDLKTTFDKKTFGDYTKYLQDEKHNIKTLIEDGSKEAAKSQAHTQAPSHAHMKTPGGNVAHAAAAAAAPSLSVTTEAFWWGFHIVFPEATLKYLLSSSGVASALTGVFAAAPAVAAVPPAAFLVAGAAAAFAIEGVAIAAVDQGNGVYLSWSWVQVPMLLGCPALALPVPTPI